MKCANGNASCRLNTVRPLSSGQLLLWLPQPSRNKGLSALVSVDLSNPPC